MDGLLRPRPSENTNGEPRRALRFRCSRLIFIEGSRGAALVLVEDPVYLLLHAPLGLFLSAIRLRRRANICRTSRTAKRAHLVQSRQTYHNILGCQWEIHMLIRGSESRGEIWRPRRDSNPQPRYVSVDFKRLTWPWVPKGAPRMHPIRTLAGKNGPISPQGSSYSSSSSSQNIHLVQEERVG